jgi:hypothetical protein
MLDALSFPQTRGILLLGGLFATIVMILSGCGVATSIEADELPRGPITQANLPEDWPQEVTTPSGFTLEFAVGGAADGREDFLAQFVAYGDRADAAAAYVAELLGTGFSLVAHVDALDIWTLKGFGQEVEVLMDTSHEGLTWLAVSIRDP